MSFSASDLAIVLPQFHAADMYVKEGGYHSNEVINSDVDSVFLPGIIDGSDSSESVRYQHRKVFVKNLSDRHVYCKVYGYNVKRNGIIKFALEKGPDRLPMIEGSESIKNYRTAPNLYSEYNWTECQSDQAMEIGNGGILSEGQGQGIWMRQACLKNISDDASDHWLFGLKYSDF